MIAQMNSIPQLIYGKNYFKFLSRVLAKSYGFPQHHNKVRMVVCSVS